MGKIKRICLYSLVFISLFSCKKTNDNYPYYLHNEYSYTSDKILKRPISAILYDNNHYVWFGSKDSSGTLFYNGYEWQQFKSEDNGLNKNVNKLIRTPDNSIWQANKNGLFRYFDNTWNKIYSESEVIDIHEVGVSNLWIATLSDVNKIIFLKVTNSNVEITPMDDDFSENINKITVDKNQKLWIATDNGLYYCDDFDEIKKYENPLLNSKNLTGITCSNHNIVWISDEDGFVYKLENDNLNIYNSGINTKLTNLNIDDNNALWSIAENRGLLKMNQNTWKLFDKDNYNLPSNNILTFCFTDDKALLISFDNGKVIRFLNV